MNPQQACNLLRQTGHSRKAAGRIPVGVKKTFIAKACKRAERVTAAAVIRYLSVLLFFFHHTLPFSFLTSVFITAS